MHSFEVKRNQKSHKVRLRALQNGFLGLSVFFDFVPKTQHFEFSKINAYKIQSLQVIQQTEKCAMQLHTNNTHTKRQSNVFIFGC